MERIEKIRLCVAARFSDSMSVDVKSQMTEHVFGVSQFCGLLAMKRGQPVELAMIAGLLHDLYTCVTLESKEHAAKGALMARELLSDLQLFTQAEIDTIATAIEHHSSKGARHDAFDEVLKDADVLQHSFQPPQLSVAEHEKERYALLKVELGL